MFLNTNQQAYNNLTSPTLQCLPPDNCNNNNVMEPLLGRQLKRQTILLDEQQLQERKHKQPTKETAGTTDKSPGVSAQTPSILEADKGGKKAGQLNDGLALRVAHPKLIHPTPVVATKHSSILKAIDKLEILAQTMDLTSVIKVQPEEEQKSVLPTPNCHEPQGKPTMNENCTIDSNKDHIKVAVRLFLVGINKQLTYLLSFLCHLFRH